MAENFQGSKQDWLLGVGLFCFFFSGAAGLLYQVVWTRMLTQIFGNTTYAIATVLSAFMAGLAIGSYLFGQIADRRKNDFLLYGILEAGVGVYGFLVPWMDRAKFAARVDQLLLYKPLARRLGENGRVLAHERFNFSSYIDGLEDLFTRTAAAPSPARAKLQPAAR